jgi:hypothetical protein
MPSKIEFSKIEFSKIAVRNTLIAIATTATLGTAHAATTTGQSSAYSIGSDIGLIATTLDTLPFGNPINFTGGVAPNPYDRFNEIASITLGPAPSLTPVFSLSTGLLRTTAASDLSSVNGGSSRFAKASSTIDDLGLGASQSLIFTMTDFFSLAATVISSEAMVSGVEGNYMTSGGAKITSLTFDSEFLTNPITLGTDYAANTVLFDEIGIRLVVNEQISDCGPVTCSMTVNAINLSFDNAAFGALGVLNGSLIIGNSFAQLSAAPVPEASTYGMMLAGLGLVGFMASRRGRR